MMRALVIVFLIVVSGIGTRGQERYIKLVADDAAIRLAPSATAQLVATGRNGDVFKLHDDKSGWFEVHMFSGEARFVQKSSAQVVAYKPVVPSSMAVRQDIYRALVATEARATAEANRKYPIAGTRSSALIDKHIEYQRVLDDQYKLAVMHRFNVQTPIYNAIGTEGAKGLWR